jgi:ATP-dependent Lon protease
MERKTFPMMPLRDIVLFPHMVAPLVVGRDRSIKALEEVMAQRSEIFLVTQKDAAVDDPQEGDLHEMGTVAAVLQLLPLPDGTIKALVEGKRRARVERYLPHEKFFMVDVVELSSEEPSNEAAGYARMILSAFQDHAKYTKKIPKEVVRSLSSIEDPVRFIDVLASHLPLRTEEKQKILSTEKLLGRMDLVLSLIYKETEIANLEERNWWWPGRGGQRSGRARGGGRKKAVAQTCQSQGGKRAQKA